MYFTTIKPATRRPLGFHPTQITTTQSQLRPSYNVIQNETGWHLEIALPGFSKEEIQVDVKLDQLTVKAISTVAENHMNSTKTIHKEFNLTEKMIQFHLNDKMDTTNIQAQSENGILHIQIPSKNPVVASAVNIEVK